MPEVLEQQRTANPSSGRRKGGLFNFFTPNDIAIDLGTANSLVFVRGVGVVLNEPSVVTFDKLTGKPAAFGMEAKRMLGRTPDAIRAVRPLRDGVIAEVDAAEAMLRHFLRTAVAKRMLRTRPRMVIGVPSGITQMEKRAVRATATAAGAREVHLIAEPMAAAIGVGLPVNDPVGSMIVDIGGGTTDTAVISLGGIVTDTSIRTAGDKIDEAIIIAVRRDHNLLIGEPTAERLKIEIGCVREGDIEPGIVAQAKGRDLVSGNPRVVDITADEVRLAIAEPIQAIVSSVLHALERTPPELASDIVDKGITLTGGGAAIHGLASLISDRSGVPVFVDEEPLTCVLRGAARVLDDFATFRNTLVAD